MDTSEAAAAMGRAGRGVSKRRGDSEHYRALAAKRKPAQVYEWRGEWGGYTVREGRAGWILDQWSAVTGERTGGRWLLAYSTDHPRTMRCDAEINDYGVTEAERIREAIKCRLREPLAYRNPGVRVLRCGHVVR